MVWYSRPTHLETTYPPASCKTCLGYGRASLGRLGPYPPPPLGRRSPYHTPEKVEPSRLFISAPPCQPRGRKRGRRARWARSPAVLSSCVESRDWLYTDGFGSSIQLLKAGCTRGERSPLSRAPRPTHTPTGYADFAIFARRVGSVFRNCQWYRICDAGASRAEPLATLYILRSQKSSSGRQVRERERERARARGGGGGGQTFCAYLCIRVSVRASL